VKTKRTKRTAEITVETDEIVVLKGSPTAVRLYCPGCRREVRMISPEQAARIAGVGPRTIYAWVGAGKVHFVETGDRSLLICADSLAAALGMKRAGGKSFGTSV
jgi:excisionase family DNA binding protein